MLLNTSDQLCPLFVHVLKGLTCAQSYSVGFPESLMVTGECV